MQTHTKYRLAFANLNGWKVAKSSFGPLRLMPYDRKDTFRFPMTRTSIVRSPDFRYPQNSRLFDHPAFFVANQRGGPKPLAIACQPYGDVAEQARAEAGRLGLNIFFAPLPKAGWWFPGSTWFFVFTVPSITRVRFLPEQTDPAAFAKMKADADQEREQRHERDRQLSERVARRRMHASGV